MFGNKNTNMPCPPTPKVFHKEHYDKAENKWTLVKQENVQPVIHPQNIPPFIL
jgi:hypothetical protein